MEFVFEKEQLLEKVKYRAPAGAYLAGGAVTSTFTGAEINDYDYYFKDKKSLIVAIRRAFEEGWWCVANTKRAITFQSGGYTAQYMHFDFFESPEKIFEKFDFTCCMGSLDMDTKSFIFHDRFLSDLAKRHLVFNHRTEFPLASGIRLKKYLAKGYKIRKRELLKLIVTINAKEASSWEALKEQIGGIYGEAFEMDSSKDFTLDNVIESIHKVNFNDKEDEFLTKKPTGPVNAQEAEKAIFGELSDHDPFEEVAA